MKYRDGAGKDCAKRSRGHYQKRMKPKKHVLHTQRNKCRHPLPFRYMTGRGKAGKGERMLQKWLDRIENLRQVQRDHSFELISANFTQRELIELKMIIETLMEYKAKSGGHCKDCKHFEYNSVTKVDGIPLILAHEICKRWGDGCKTSEDGYCFLFEPKESGGKDGNI